MKNLLLPVLLGLALARSYAQEPSQQASDFRGVCAKKFADANAAYAKAMDASDKADKAGDAAAAERHRAAAMEAMTVVGRDGWLFLAGELRHVGAGRFWGADAVKVNRGGSEKLADPLPAIVSYSESCRKLGITLIFVPVPPRAVIYPDKLADGIRLDAKGLPPRLDAAHQEFYKLLRDKGVTVLDLTDDFIAARDAMPDGTGIEQMCCKTDTHWSGSACAQAAWKIAKQVKDADWTKKLSRNKYPTRFREVEIAGDLWRNLPKDKQPPKETLPLRFVGTKAADGADAVQPDPASPVVLLGDSHALVFHLGQELHATGAGLPDQLAFELGVPVDLHGTRGSGARPARVNLYRRAIAEPDYIAGKKLIIWCLAARELTESAWGDVPVAK